jgi:hypothetical protein
VDGFVSEAIVYQTGATFAANEGQPYMYARFRQHLPLWKPGDK